MTTTLEAKQRKLALLKQKQKLKEELPHLYGLPFYKWARLFFDSTDKEVLLCAANQIGKSSIQIRKVIHWATDQKLWKKLWRKRPLQFWYLYPTLDVATIEFEKKWVPEFLPNGSMKDDPVYGWRAEYRNRVISVIHFNSGVSIYFKSYSSDAQNLQTGTCEYIACDEELPIELYDELNARRAATDGYFSIVFTATLGQPWWQQAIEGTGPDVPLKTALKIQVSMDDCLFYDDGTRSHWTAERIQQRRNSCKSKAEEARRVDGKFVLDEGLKYPSFDKEANVKPDHPLPLTWFIYAGVDIGSGGAMNHPAAIVFVAVSPDYRQGRVFKGWRGDDETTTADDVLKKYQELRGNMQVTAAFYDWAAIDFATIAVRTGETFQKAEKSHEIGEKTLNVLFKNQMLAIYNTAELQPLVSEFCSLLRKTHKSHAKDDFIDALRYCVTRIPWDFNAINGKPIEVEKPKAYDALKDRRGEPQDPDEALALLSIEDELDEWSETYEA